ncbi:hypothetical protein M378DRAFT_17099 [Amanita muscaria Koide BX008]|uniref:RNI-like protein n=1 Tax=Amanita muscaria (strain Koide BX008) TaxID=946122 RepID=A0A0C2WIE9_AMAMK|nr:hypothetical protein M378DRAFT_17099 [Amanita muscaria Koide BX008]
MVSSPSTPSSSAVTIPVPGKSILKRPPPTNNSLLSRITRFLPDAGFQNTPTNGNNTGSNNLRQTVDTANALKRAHFVLPEIAIVYPISSMNPPSTPTLKEEKMNIEEREKERRRRVLSGRRTLSSSSSGSSSGLNSGNGGRGGGDVASGNGGEGEGESYWSMDRVESFYRECCAGCDEDPDSAISAAFKNATPTNPRCVDLSGVQLTFTSASILSDVFTIEWGLRKLVFKECDLDEVTLKPILHSLLIPGSLSYLSIASNKRMKAPAFRLIGAYVAMAKSLQFLDVSLNSLDKKSVEYIVAALPPAPERALVSLRMDDCQLRPAALETLCRAVRTSSLRNISLRYNRISASGAVALALMIRDYPDVYPSSTPTSPTGPNFPNATLSTPSSTTTTNNPSTISLSSFSSFSSFLSISTSSTPSASPSTTIPPPVPSVPSTPTTPTNPTHPLNTPNHNTHHHHHHHHNNLTPHPLTKSGPILPPPRHPTTATQPVQTTYTPYVPRSKRTTGTNDSNALPNAISSGAGGGSVPSQPQSPTIPIIASSLQGGVTSRYVPSQNGSSSVKSGVAHTAGSGSGGGSGGASGGVDNVMNHRHDAGPSVALLDKVRALDSLPRLGALRTLDLKGNELRNGISYISQVLKRNRTLKVLNLSENKLDVQALVLVAEALKYNSCLEMLDLSKNPCCGPSLDGIQSLRTAFTLNTALKRLFLSGTQMSSAGAIALAEFLPESTSLLHLDLTNNVLDIAGVMALSSGLKSNHVMRCLDLNIPENDDEFSRMCRDILNTCIRNTEEAAASARKAHGGGQENQSASQRQQQQQRGIAVVGKGVWGMIEESSLARSIRLAEEKQSENDIIAKARLCATQLEESLSSLSASSPSPSSVATPQLSEQAQKARTILLELTSAIQATDDDRTKLSDLLAINDRLVGLLAKVPVVKKPMLILQGLKGLGVVLKKEEEGAAKELNGHAVSSPAGDEVSSITLPSGSTSVIVEAAKAEEDEELEDETPTTPRIDKGKARAVPEPEEPEKILKPAFLITESSEDEDEDTHYVTGEVLPGSVASPTDRSRIWVEEEGEVFRKGTVLLGPEELEGEYDSEDLRREILEAMVERPPPRPITDEYGLEIAPVVPVQEVEPKDNSSNNSPPEPAKPPPKPYIPRRTPSLRSNSNPSSPLQSPVTQSPSTPL